MGFLGISNISGKIPRKNETINLLKENNNNNSSSNKKERQKEASCLTVATIYSLKYIYMELSLPAEKAISLSGCSNARSTTVGAALPTINFPKIDQFIESGSGSCPDGRK